MALKRISDLDDAAELTGAELLEVEVGGESRKCTAQAIADLADPPGSAVDSVNGRTGAVALTARDVPAGIRTETASATAGATDEVVVMNVASANNFTIPPNGDVAIAVGRFLEVWQAGAGQTTLVAGSGVTLLYPADLTLKLRAQNSGASLRKVATDTWRVVGDLEEA